MYLSESRGLLEHREHVLLHFTPAWPKNDAASTSTLHNPLCHRATSSLPSLTTVFTRETITCHRATAAGSVPLPLLYEFDCLIERPLHLLHRVIRDKRVNIRSDYCHLCAHPEDHDTSKTRGQRARAEYRFNENCSHMCTYKCQ